MFVISRKVTIFKLYVIWEKISKMPTNHQIKEVNLYFDKNVSLSYLFEEEKNSFELYDFEIFLFCTRIKPKLIAKTELFCRTFSQNNFAE